MLRGNTGNDQLWGNDGEDTVKGGDGADKLQGGKRNDVLDGGSGNDRLKGDGGTSDTCRGSTGVDHVWVSCDNFSGHEIGPFTLPFPVGQNWVFSSGPHVSPTVSTKPWNALDFAKNSGTVTAAADGTAYRISFCHVKVVHGSGWETQYYHLKNIPSTITAAGVKVKMGDSVGKASTNCPPNSGDHVHFTVWRNGNRIALSGIRLDKWKPVVGQVQYEGCLVRMTDGHKECASYSTKVGHNANWDF